MGIPSQYWAALVAATVALLLYVPIAVRAFFFRPPVTMAFLIIFAVSAVVGASAQAVGMVIAMVGAVALVGWHTYYVYVDWKSRSLRWLVGGFGTAFLATAVLLLTR